MPMKNNLNQRSERLAKRRKTNTILNSLIAIVIILILIVSYRIFFSSNEPGQKSDQVAKQEANNSNGQNSSGTVNKDDDKDNDKDKKEDTDKKDDQKEKEDTDKDKDKDDEKIVEKSDEPNVENTIVDPSWEAVGTDQTNGHQYSSSMDSLDWKEKEQALSYATDIPVDNMVIWWLERGPDGDHQSIGTISPKDAQSEVYRVHLEWEDGKGWKPVIVKKLISNDKR